MAVKHKRDYEHIIGELMDALKHLEGYYRFLEIDDRDWDRLDEEEQGECLKTMSHDIIYGLGGESTIQVGQGSVHYEPESGQIRVYDGEKCVYIVQLN